MRTMTEPLLMPEYIGMYNRYDKVPKEVWSAHVYTVGAEAEDVLSVMIEDEK